MNLSLFLADGQVPAVPGVPVTSLPQPSPEATAFLIFTLVIVTVFLGGAFIWVLVGLARNREWTIADAVSEEAGNQPDPLPPGVKPRMVASSSRLIAVFGFLALIGMSIGVGYAIIWSIFTGRKLELQGLLSYFYGMGALFAPYAVNQLKEAFSSFAQPSSDSPEKKDAPANSSSSTPARTPDAAASASTTASSGQGAIQPASQPTTSSTEKPPLVPSVRLPALKQPTQPGNRN